MKRILLFLIMFLLCSCASDQTEAPAKKYISPTTATKVRTPTADFDALYERQQATNERKTDLSIQQATKDAAGSASFCPNGCIAHVAGCDIKGNVSVDGKEKIYHVPGGLYYASTQIDSKYGERWFCTEAEAQASGWRRSAK
jgi:hypothetical protein